MLGCVQDFVLMLNEKAILSMDPKLGCLMDPEGDFVLCLLKTAMDDAGAVDLNDLEGASEAYQMDPGSLTAVCSV